MKTSSLPLYNLYRLQGALTNLYISSKALQKFIFPCTVFTYIFQHKLDAYA